MSGSRGSFSSFSLYVADDTWVTCHRYAEQTPILAISAGDSSVSLSIVDRKATDAAVKFARALAREAEAFAAEVERVHAHSAATESADSDDRAA
jgi:hypothetical protein